MLVIVPLPVFFIWSAICSYVMADRLKKIFSNSPILQQDQRFVRNLGLFGKIITCGCVFLICLTPKLSVRHGLALKSELESMPKELRFWLYPPFFALNLWFGALLLLGIVY